MQPGAPPAVKQGVVRRHSATRPRRCRATTKLIRRCRGSSAVRLSVTAAAAEHACKVDVHDRELPFLGPPRWRALGLERAWAAPDADRLGARSASGAAQAAEA